MIITITKTKILGMLDDDDDDYYMYFSDNDDADEDEMDFNLLREALYRNFRYGGDAFF